MNAERVNMVEGHLFKKMVKLAWPVIAANLLQTMYNIIDAFWLGKLGRDALSAPTISWPVIFTALSFAFGLSVAASSLVSQYTGRGEEKTSAFIMGQVLSISLILSICIGIAGAILSRPILTVMGAKDAVLDLSDVYMRTIFLGSPTAFVLFTVGGAFRGWGNSRIGMNLTTISVLINVILDPLMIFGIGFPRMDVFGAALATVISRGVSAAYALYIIFSGVRGMRIQPKDLIPHWRYTKLIFKVSFFSSLGQSITSLGFTFVMSVVARFGAALISAFGVGHRVTSMMVMFSGGVAAAVATAVGQALGAGKEDRAVRAIKMGAWFNFVVIGGLCVLTFFYGRYVTAVFINDPEVVEIGRIYFKLVSFSIPFFAVMQALIAALDGSGHTFQSAVVNIARLWGVRIPLVYLLTNLYGFTGIFYAMIASNIAALILVIIALSIGTWKKPIINVEGR